jgi:uncharacterized protein (TIGR02996 family)
VSSPLDAVRATPDDREIYAVLGDWLQGRGELHGELIALALRAEPSTDIDLAARIAELRRQLAPTVHGLRLDWRWGCVWRAHVGTHVGHDTLCALVTASHGGLIRELVIEEGVQRWIDLLVELAPRLPVLRSLVLERGRARRAVSLAALWSAFPQLERAVIGALRARQPIALPHVRELSVHLAIDEDYASWDVPELVALDIAQIRRPRWLADLDPARLPQLRRLSATTVEGGPEAIAALPVGEHLELIDLWRYPEDGDGQRLVIDRTPPSRHGALLVTGGCQVPLGTCVDAQPAGSFLGRATRVTAICLDGDAGRRQAQISRVEDHWQIADVSRCQTRVNRRLLEDPTPLVDGDEITISANAIRFFAGRDRAEHERARLGLPHPSQPVA